MSDHNSTAQVPPTSNSSPPTAANFVLDTLTGQHNTMIDHLNAAISSRFNEIYEVCQTILQQQTTLNSDHRHLMSQLEEIRQSDLNHRKEMSSLLNNRLPNLENSLCAVDRKVDLLSLTVRQMDQRLSPLEDGIREVDLTSREVLSRIKDSRILSGWTPPQAVSSNHLLKFPETPSFPLDSIFEIPQSSPTGQFVHSINPSQLRLIPYNQDSLQDTYEQAPTGKTGLEAGSSVESYSTPETRAKIITDETRATLSPSPPNLLARLEELQVLQRTNPKRRSSSRLQASSQDNRNAQISHLSASLFGSDSSELTDMDLEDSSGKIIPTKEPLMDNRSKTGTVAPYHRKSVSFASKTTILYPPKDPSRTRKKRVGARLGRRNVRKDAMIVRGVLADAEPIPHTDYEMIGCDSCARWYHCACVNLHRSDIETMNEDTPYHCPACPPKNDLLFSKAQTTREGGCSAQKCIIGDDGFSIDFLVGRKPDPALPGNYLWLIKWYGFDVEDSTWKPTNTFDSAALIVEWYESAEKEGHNPKYLASHESGNDIILIGNAKGKGPWPESND